MERTITPHDVPPQVREVCETLRHAGYGAWVVGGCVRDVLFGRKAGDWDICTSAKPTDVQRLFRRVIPTGIAHGTVTVLSKGESFEVTTLRGEGAYTDGRRPDSVCFVDDIDLDLSRRDFTVNAMAFDPIDGKLVDPFGGMNDMDARTLRAVGDAHARFSEDGLRVLRAARFAATLDLEIEPSTLAAIPATLDTFRKVSPERVRDEWMKTMKATKPSRAFRIMERTGMLAVTCPELVKQVGCEQNRYHAYDVWEHSLECLDALDGAPIQRVAALLHDLGKPATRVLSDKTNDFTFYHHEAVGAEMADKWLRAYRFSNDERETVVHLVKNHLICYSDEWTDAAVRRFVKRIGVPHIDPLLRLGCADVLAKGKPVDAELALLDRLRVRIDQVLAAGDATGIKDLRVDGNLLMKHFGIRPGRHIGVILGKLLDRVLDDPSLNDADMLLEIAKPLVEEASS